MSSNELDHAQGGAALAHPEGQTHMDRLERLLHRHHRAVSALLESQHRSAPRLEVVDLSVTTPVVILQDVNGKTPIEGLSIINPNAVAINVGWPGNRAGAGLGVTVAANGYLRVPIRTNLVDVAATAGFGGATELSVFVFEHDFPPDLAGGGLQGGGGTSTSTTASAVTGASPRTVPVGVATVVALPANSSRKGSSFVNTGTTNISLGLGAAAVVGDDIVLVPDGSWDGMVGPALWTGAVNAISSAAGGSLAVVEV